MCHILHILIYITQQILKVSWEHKNSEDDRVMYPLSVLENVKVNVTEVIYIYSVCI